MNDEQWIDAGDQYVATKNHSLYHTFIVTTNESLKFKGLSFMEDEHKLPYCIYCSLIS